MAAIAPARVAAQLSRVGDARIRREIGLQRDHPLEGGKGRPVASQLDLGVADDAERPRRVGGERAGLAPEHESLPELVADQRQVAEPERGGRVSRGGGERSPQRGLRARQVARIARLAPAQLVGEPERRERCRVVRRLLQRCFQPRDRRLRAARRRSRRARSPRPRTATRRRSGRRRETRRARRRRGPRRPARSRQRRRRGAWCVVSSSLPPLSSCAPCARSPGWAPPRTGSAGRNALLVRVHPVADDVVRRAGCRAPERRWRIVP